MSPDARIAEEARDMLAEVYLLRYEAGVMHGHDSGQDAYARASACRARGDRLLTALASGGTVVPYAPRPSL